MTFPFELHTPYHLFYKGAAELVSLTIADGEIAIMAGHSAVTAPVKTGILKIKDGKGSWKTAFISDGILEVKEHNTVVLSEAAEWSNEIDRDRALKAKAAAEELLKEGSFRFEIDKAASSLRRAEVRLKVCKLEHNKP